LGEIRKDAVVNTKVREKGKQANKVLEERGKSSLETGIERREDE